MTSVELSDSDFAILNVLSDGKTHSGSSIGASLGVSRTTVWQSVQSLMQVGIRVDALPGKGYRLQAPLELLNYATIHQELSAAAKQRIAHWYLFPVVDSTSRFLKEKNLNSASASVCAAEMQTQGKGRRGRRWISPLACNLYFSLEWGFDTGLNALAGLSAATAVIISVALRDAGVGAVRVKWPNDIYCDNKKLAGILIEATGEAHGQCRAIIGIGLNVAMPPDVDWPIDQAWTDLSRCVAQRPSRNALLAMLINALVDGLERFQRRGLLDFLPQWKELDMLAGCEVRVESGQGVVVGLAQGVDEFGALRLQTAAGINRYHSGDVSVRLQNGV